MKESKLKLWQTITIGMPNLKTKEDFLLALRKRGINTIARYLDQEMDEMVKDLISQPTDIKLARIRAKDVFEPADFISPIKAQLGKLLEVLEKAGANTKLPFEAGIYLSLQVRGSCLHGGVHVAVNPIVVKGYGPCGIFLTGSAINSDCVSEGQALMPDYCVIVGM